MLFLAFLFFASSNRVGVYPKMLFMAMLFLAFLFFSISCCYFQQITTALYLELRIKRFEVDTIIIEYNKRVLYVCLVFYFLGLINYKASI